VSAERGVVAVVETQLSNFGLTPLRAAFELGYRALFMGRDPERYHVLGTAEEVFSTYVDEVVKADTNSVDAVVQALAGVHGQGLLRGVLTVTDYQLPIVAEVARRFGLPGLSPDAARRCRDKLLMRQACAEADVPVPRFHHVSGEADALRAAADVGLPCVVKPMTESASIGVTLCRTPAEVSAAYHAISSVPHDFRGQPRRAGALLEEYLLGVEVSVESVLVDGQRDVLGVTDQTLGPHPYFVEIGDTFPSMLSARTRDACVDVALAALAAVGHDFGAAHVEVKVTGDGPRVVEVNGRMAGDEISALIREALGVYLQREVVRLHAGEPADLSRDRDRAAASRYLVATSAGTLHAIDGADLARRALGVVEVEFEVRPGDPVVPPANNLDLLGHVIAVADTPGEAARLGDAALCQLTVDVGPP
jgi:biotin carboxylase